MKPQSPVTAEDSWPLVWPTLARALHSSLSLTPCSLCPWCFSHKAWPNLSPCLLLDASKDKLKGLCLLWVLLLTMMKTNGSGRRRSRKDPWWKKYYKGPRFSQISEPWPPVPTPNSLPKVLRIHTKLLTSFLAPKDTCSSLSLFFSLHVDLDMQSRWVHTYGTSRHWSISSS